MLKNLDFGFDYDSGYAVGTPKNIDYSFNFEANLDYKHTAIGLESDHFVDTD